MDKASMAQIAGRADVSQGACSIITIPAKDALIFDIIRTHLSELNAAIAAAENATLPPTRPIAARWSMPCWSKYRDADDLPHGATERHTHAVRHPSGRKLSRWNAPSCGALQL